VSVFEAAGGSEGLLRLAEAWHRRCLEDPVVSHAFSHGHHPQHTERLAAYWEQALGGPAGYTATIGDHSAVLRMHSGNGEHEEMDQCAVACFAAALEDAGLASDAALRASLTAWFEWMIGVMATYPRAADDVPVGLPLPVWSWHGPA
jgi:hemoglobin